MNDPRTARAYVCRNAYERAALVLYVVHEDDGWQLLCGGDEHDDVAEIEIIHAGHIIDRDPTLAEVFDLPFGCEAHRPAVGAPWVRSLSPYD